jgi:hypothetical protein
MVPALAVKPAVELPAGTVTDAGTDSAELLLESETVAPPPVAAWLSVTVQVAELPEVRDVGLQFSADGVTGAINEMDAFCVVPLRVAVIVAV